MGKQSQIIIDHYITGDRYLCFRVVNLRNLKSGRPDLGLRLRPVTTLPDVSNEMENVFHDRSEGVCPVETMLN